MVDLTGDGSESFDRKFQFGGAACTVIELFKIIRVLVWRAKEDEDENSSRVIGRGSKMGRIFGFVWRHDFF